MIAWRTAAPYLLLLLLLLHDTEMLFFFFFFEDLQPKIVSCFFFNAAAWQVRLDLFAQTAN